MTAVLDEKQIVHVDEGQVSCDDAWEAAFQRFETPEQEILKFSKRLKNFGCDGWERNLSVLEIFCGRGASLLAWEQLGFRNLEGADLSANLISQYSGPAKCYVADCRKLPFDDQSKDVIAVQGGLHHLPELPSDVERTVSEVRRVLKPGGRFLVVEPWDTPFLRFVHWVSSMPLARRLWDKLDAFEELYIHEKETYDQWRFNPGPTLQILRSAFEVERLDQKWGKLMFVGRRPAN